jgi:peptidoglycan/LPS O-acetylase OafA/YrhL
MNALRLLLASCVLVSHCIKLQGGRDPLGLLLTPDVDFGTMAVDGFFVLSGFLIVRSYTRSASTWRYLWHRALRILPGFWVCLLVSAAVLLPLAQLIQFGTLSGFPLTGDQSALGYVLHNASLHLGQFHVRGLLNGQPVNGSLHTLFYEALCYIGVALLGVAVARSRLRWAVLGAAVAAWLLTAADLGTGGAVTGGSIARELMLRFGLMFLVGATYFLWADRIRTGRAWLTGGGVALVLAGVATALTDHALPHQVFTDGGLTGARSATLVYSLLAPPSLALLLLVAGASRRFAWVGSRRDLSYGVYVYAYPLQVTLLLLGAATWPAVTYVLATGVLTAGAALLSWTFVEAPALNHKSWTAPLPQRLLPRRYRAEPTPDPKMVSSKSRG